MKLIGKPRSIIRNRTPAAPPRPMKVQLNSLHWLRCEGCKNPFMSDGSPLCPHCWLPPTDTAAPIPRPARGRHCRPYTGE